MQQDIFQTIPLIERSFLQKIFGQYPNDNALIELNNLLTKNKITDINHNQIKEIESKYNVDLNSEYSLNLEEFYAVYLNHCLIDKILSDEEVIELSHLKSLLSLSDKTIQKLHSKLGAIIYKESFEEVVRDGKISSKEKEFIEKLENDLMLPKELAEKIALETSKFVIENHLSHISADKRISPDEELEFKKLAKNLGVKINLDDNAHFKLNKLKQYWSIENLSLPVIDIIDIEIQKSENCYLKLPFANWYEHRARQKNNYSSYLVNKDMMGFHLNPGSRGCNTYQLSLIEKGEIYLTNKRIVFIGQEKNYNIKLDKILNIIPYTDGIEIIKDGGKNPTIQVRDNADILCLTIQRLINER